MFLIALSRERYNIHFYCTIIDVVDDVGLFRSYREREREIEREREREKYMRSALLLKVMLFVDSLNLTEKKRFPCF